VISAAMAGYWFRWGGWRNRRLLDEGEAEFLEQVRAEAAIEEGGSF
jgi:hypothetical protein